MSELTFDSGQYRLFKKALKLFRLNGNPLTRNQKESFLLTGELPKGTEYPAILLENAQGWGSKTQQQWQALEEMLKDGQQAQLHGKSSTGPYATVAFETADGTEVFIRAF